MKNIALVGYGRMGKEIERAALERGHTITARIDAPAPRLTASTLGGADVAIHFALPDTVLPQAEECAEAGISMVIGTTGWDKHKARVAELAQAHRIGIVASSNFSLGMNLFLRMVRNSAGLFQKFPEYDLFLHEVHHRDKADSPSGTALTIARELLSRIDRKQEILAAAPEGKIKPEQLHVSSVRGGTVVGTHTLTFDSAADSIELTHTAKNRSGFALGAVIAAEWLGNRAGLFSMDDVLEDLT